MVTNSQSVFAVNYTFFTDQLVLPDNSIQFGFAVCALGLAIMYYCMLFHWLAFRSSRPANSLGLSTLLVIWYIQASDKGSERGWTAPFYWRKVHFQWLQADWVNCLNSILIIMMTIIIRSRCLGARCGLLLQRSRDSMISVCLCMLGTGVSTAETSEPVELPLPGRRVWAQRTMY